MRSLTESLGQFDPDRGFDVRAQLHRLTDRRIRLSRAYEEQIRASDSNPVGLLSADDLREAAADGPIVVINVSWLRCDAIVIQTSGTRVVPLPDLTYADARSAAIRYHEGLLMAQAAS